MSDSPHSTNTVEPTFATPPVRVQLVFPVEAFILLSFLAWVVVKRTIRKAVRNNIGTILVSPSDLDRIRVILAQINSLSGSSRVVLCIFHNGSVTPYGYHYLKLSTVAEYLTAGVPPLTDEIADLPLDKINDELAELFDHKGWLSTKVTADLPGPCIDYLKRNLIYQKYDRLLRLGALPVGILSIQYTTNCCDVRRLQTKDVAKDLDNLYYEVKAIVRERIVDPTIFRKVLEYFLKLRTF